MLDHISPLRIAQHLQFQTLEAAITKGNVDEFKQLLNGIKHINDDDLYRLAKTAINNERVEEFDLLLKVGRLDTSKTDEGPFDRVTDEFEGGKYTPPKFIVDLLAGEIENPKKAEMLCRTLSHKPEESDYLKKHYPEVYKNHIKTISTIGFSLAKQNVARDYINVLAPFVPGYQTAKVMKSGYDYASGKRQAPARGMLSMIYSLSPTRLVSHLMQEFYATQADAKALVHLDKLTDGLLDNDNDENMRLG